MEQTSLREAMNVVKIHGVLKEKSLEIRSSEKGRFISGYVVIQTDANSAHRVNVYASEKTREGKDSGLFKGFVTVKDEHVSLADCATEGWGNERATRVTVDSGRLGLNEYYGEDGMLHSSWSISANFISRAKDEYYKPKATFEVEGYIDSIKEKDEKVFVNLIVPVYGGKAIPISFSTNGEAGQFILDNYKRGDSTRFSGNIVNLAEKEVKYKEGFGGRTEEVTIKYVRALVIDNGDPSPFDPDDDNTKAWFAKDIKVAMEARETYLEELKSKSSKKTTSSPKSSGKTQDFDF